MFRHSSWSGLHCHPAQLRHKLMQLMLGLGRCLQLFMLAADESCSMQKQGLMVKRRLKCTNSMVEPSLVSGP